MSTKQIKEKLLLLLPHWNLWITRPLKQYLEDDMNLEMYYCLQALYHYGPLTMSEFAKALQVPNHKMSKLANRLHEHGYIERIHDSEDRRIIRVKISDEAIVYLTQFFEQNTHCFQDFLEKLDDSECEQFEDAVNTLLTLFCKIPGESAKKGKLKGNR